MNEDEFDLLTRIAEAMESISDQLTRLNNIKEREVHILEQE